MKVIFPLILGMLLVHQPAHSERATAVKIVHLEDHSMRLDTKLLQQILTDDRLKDRHLVVFSIAGPYRKGKSFFLNFALKYLHARYVKHDISDWIGENDIGNDMSGFKWRGGQKPETTGIWMWSELFTHDHENGERVAIMLLDTQGIYDHSSSMMDCTATFAISVMVSSVMCYNVMQNVQEDNLQDLDYFTQYGRLAIEQTTDTTTPFQRLLFLVRDWPYAEEMDYGYAPKYIDRILAIDDKKTPEMRELRERIQESFEEIDAFLLPYPGTAVAEGKNKNGDLRQIDGKFVQQVKEIVPSIFAPEKLLVKQINGQKLRAQDLLTYLGEYVKIFNGKALPEPKTALMATAEASLLILHRECLMLYARKMDEVMGNGHSFYTQSDLSEWHVKARKETLSQFRNKRKLDFPAMISSYERQLENDIAQKYSAVLRINDERRKNQLRMDEQRRRMDEELRRMEDKKWNPIFSAAGAAVATGLCTTMGWNPFVAAACAVGGAVIPHLN